MFGGLGITTDPVCSSSSSITELLGALCDTCVSGVSWKRRALGAVSREGVRRALRQRAYGALLSKLFQEGSPKGAPGLSSTASTPPRNKVLMISFNLRVAGCQEEAERLEGLLGSLGEVAADSGLVELDSALELLVQLAGSVPPPATSFSRDHMRRERPVLRRPPLRGYLSEELQRLEARTWALMWGEELGALGGVRGTLGLMEAPPGSGLLGLGGRCEGEERFEKETRRSLFGALQHHRTSDLDVRLDLPPVPSNAEVAGLAIRVPPSLDQSEDEGFQSASNLTPDSQSEPSPSPELDVWEALRDFEPGRRRCWERVGCPPGSKEDPYLSEGGREAFDHWYRLCETRVLGLAPASPLPPMPLDSQSQLVGDLLNVLIGVASTTFPLNQSCVEFEVRPGVCISGASPESLSRLLGELAECGTHYLRLSRFSLQSAQKRGLVFQAFTGGLRRYLQYYRACVLSTPPTLSLLTIRFLFRKLGRQLRYLSELCCVDGAPGGRQATFPVGVKLLSYLYNEAQRNCSNENHPVLLSLLKKSCGPYTRFVSDWVYGGVFRDVFGEFMIQVNEDYLSFRDKHFWEQGYTLISRDVEECVPVFLRHIANDVYVCGKTINLLKICCPQHYICWSELPVPRIAVTFSLQEVEDIERDCAIYRGRVGRIAAHSAVSREEQALRTEKARQELISQVRVSTAKTLESIRGLQVSQRLAEEARKRERFEELKQQLEQEQEWRETAKRKEQEDEFGFVRELSDRERRLQALEEELERRARKELIAQYSQLSEEAARRESRALWRVQRMRLDQARTHFLEEDQRLTQALLEQYPLGQQGPPPDPLPTAASTQQPTQASQGPREEEEIQSMSPSLQHPPPAALPPRLEDRTLISDELDFRDFLPKPPHAPDFQEVDKALQDIGSDLRATPPASEQSQDYDFSAPYTPLQGGHARPHWSPVVPPNIQGREEASEVRGDVQSSGFQGPQSQSSVFPGLEQLPRAAEPLGYGQEVKQLKPEPACGTETSYQQGAALLELESSEGEGVDNARLTGAPQGPPTSEEGRASNEDAQATGPQPDKQPHPSDAPVKEGTFAPEVFCPVPVPNIHSHAHTITMTVRKFVSPVEPASPSPSPHGHASDAHIRVGEHVSEVTTPVPAPSIHGHASDAHIRVGEHVSEVTIPVPTPSIHGHTSDAHIRVGEHVSEVTNPVPTPSIHGHASDAHIRVGEHVSEVTNPVPTPSIHGHASDAHIRVGEHVSEVTIPVPTPSIHGHASDAHIRVGEHVSEVTNPVPTPSIHGHASDAHIRVGEHVSEVTIPVPAPSIHGHASDAHIRLGEHVSKVTIPVPAPSIHGHASDAHIRVGEHVAEVMTPVPAPSIHGHASDAHISVVEHVSEVTIPVPTPSIHGHASDAHISVVEHVSEVTIPVPTPSIHGHASDAHIRVGEHVAEVMTPVPAPSIHGHASDAHIRVGEHVSEVTTPVPAPSIHGHASEAHIRVGEHVSEVTIPVPTHSIHGHASDAHIRVGEHVSEVTIPVPTPSIHGHASDAHIRIGEHVSEVTNPVPTPSIHGHASDSSIKVGGFVSNVTPSHPRWNKHGHSSESTLGIGCVVPGSEPLLSPLPGSAYGHSSDSALKVGCVVTGMEPSLLPLPGSAYGHSSDSALKVGCVVTGMEPSLLPLPGSAYGHSSDSALKVGCVVTGMEPSLLPLPGSAYGHSSDSALRTGCVVSETEPLPTPLPVSSYGHSSDSALGTGCVVIGHGELPLPPATGISTEAGLQAEPEGGMEQDYLTSLAAQYEVEQYQDTYNLMTSAPDLQLLQQVTRAPYRLPVDPSLHRATDTTAVQLSEMVCLPMLMKHSVTTPLITHVSLVNKAVVDYFFVELGVERHFEALRHFLLMEDGEFAQSLSDLLFEKLGSGQTPGELLTPLVLNSILSKALQYSLHGDNTLAANFTFALRFLPETFHPLAPDALNCLELRYKVDWPLNIIITDSCMNKYNRLFSFLLQLKHMVWTLRDVWFHLKRAALVKGAGGSVQFRQLQLYRHEMQHFVKVIQGYIANQILQVCWSEFTHKLSSASDLDAIHRTHADYLNRAIFRGLLTDKAASVMNIIHSIFSLILKFRAQLIAQPWSCQQGEAVHPSFVALQQSYNTFKYYSHFLFKVVTTLVNRSYQPHLEDFLLRINFNNYYKES